MIKATVVYPKDRKTKITCSRCEICYSVRDYDILFENQKLIYFKAKTLVKTISKESVKINKYITSARRQRVYCNDCLFEFAKKLGKILKTSEIKLEILAENEKYVCKVYVFGEE